MGRGEPGDPHGRRALLERMIATGGLVLVGCGSEREPAHEDGAEEDARAPAETTAAEDLMSEHGLIERVLLVYEASARRILASEELDRRLIARAASVMQRFVHDYHERTEERYVFPELERAGRDTDVVRVLRTQHDAGREVTRAILAACDDRSEASGARIVASIEAFTRMYRPHKAREDTVIFAAFRELTTRAQYRELGERFEEEEHARFGEHGFDDLLGEVGSLEQALAIDDLSRFTPTSEG